MKKSFSKIALLVFVMILSFMTIHSCKKSDNSEDTKSNQQPSGNETLPSSPEASSSEDNKSGGVYKGTFVGSTGYVKITLQSGKKEVVVSLDGVSKKLDAISFDPESWTSGQAITQAVFRKDNWTVKFSVDADGENPNVDLEIPGHENIMVTIIKETSVMVAKSFEGNITYEGKSTNSAFNFVINGELFIGLGRMPGEEQTYTMVGVLKNGKIQATINNATVAGTLDGDNATGTIVTPNATANWSAKRTQ